MRVNTLFTAAVTGLSLLPGLTSGLPSSKLKTSSEKTTKQPALSNSQLEKSTAKSRNPIFQLFDPDQKLEACATAEATRGDLAITLLGMPDSSLKWEVPPILKTDGSEKLVDGHEISKKHINMVSDFTSELMKDLKVAEGKQFVEKMPEGLSDLKAAQFTNGLKDAKEKCADVRKECIASLQQGYTIMLRVDAKGSAIDAYNARYGKDSLINISDRLLEAYQRAPVWHKLQLMIRNVGSFIDGFQSFLASVSIEIKDSELLLTEKQRGGLPIEITKNEERWIKADGTWKWMGQYYAKAYKVKDEDGPVDLSRSSKLRLARFMAGRGAEQLSLIRDELIKRKEALLKKLETQLDPNSEYMEVFNEYLSQIGGWNLKKDIFQFKLGLSDQVNFPDKNILDLWMDNLVQCFVIINTVLHQHSDLLEELKGLTALATKEQEKYVPKHLLEQAAEQLKRVRDLEDKRLKISGDMQRKIGGLLEASLAMVKKHLEQNTAELIAMKKRLLAVEPAAVEGQQTAASTKVTEEELGISPDPSARWYNLKPYAEKKHADVAGSLPNQESIVKLRRNLKEKHVEYLKQLPVIYNFDPTNENSATKVSKEIEEYLQNAIPRYNEDKTEITSFSVPIKKELLPLMPRIKVDFAVAQMYNDIIPHMMKKGNAELQQKVNEYKLQQYIHDPAEGEDPKVVFKDRLNALQVTLANDLAEDLKATNDAALDVLSTVEETLALRRDVASAKTYIEELEQHIKQPKWLIELKMSSPTLSTAETTEFILRQLFALDYVSEILEKKINRASDYTTEFYKIVNHLKIGDEESRASINGINTKLSTMKQDLKDYITNGAPLIATNLRSMLKDTAEYLNNAKTSIITGPKEVSYLKPEEKIEMWDDLQRRAETLICVKAVVQHFSMRNARVKQSLTKNMRQELNFEIDQIRKPVEEVRRYLRDNHPRRTSRVHSFFDYEQEIDEKAVMDKCRAWAKAWEGQEARWHFQFPQEATFENVLKRSESEPESESESEKKTLPPKKTSPEPEPESETKTLPRKKKTL